MKWLRRAGFLMLLLLLAAAATGGFYVRQVLPKTDGSIRINGLHTEIRIERDADGIPTIEGASLEDVAFGLGFVHAQDRLWQLETHRRIASGRLAEAFGEGALDSDRFLRALGVKRAAAAQWAHAGARTKAVVGAYTNGINAYLRDAMGVRPPEFVLLGLNPEPWTPEDTMAWVIMMAWDLGGNWNTELLRMRLALKLPTGRVDELVPPYPGDKSLVSTDYAALYRELRVDGKLAQHALTGAPASGIEGVGSNNWVIAGSHTVTGKPLLANDPHLKLTTPALWYFARLVAPGLKVAGATMPALPGVVLGQNENIAWGFTNTGPDVQDLYLERIKPDDPMQYQTPAGWARFDSFEEVIKVKGRPDVPITVRATRHGPVISDAGRATDGLTGPAAKPTYAIAMRWTALDPDLRTLDAAVGFNEAKSVADFVATSAAHAAPMQNMVVADRDGHIGFVAAGRVPLRRPDNDLMGQVPAPGWDARYDWVGSLDPSLTPREFDPPRGWIATANQRIHGPDYPHYIGSDWALPYRQWRIEKLLAAHPKHSMETLREMQADVKSLAAKHLLPYVRRAQSSHPLAREVQRQLAGFDGTMDANRAAPLVLWAWARHLAQGLFADEIGAALWETSDRAFRHAMEGVLERDDGWWCDDKTTAITETCQWQINAAFDKALHELQAAQGADVDAWRWGRAHVARSEHRPFSQVGLLARWFELRTPVGGDTYTLNVSRVNLRPDRRTGELYLDEHGPSFRAAYDLADPSRSRFMHSSGQSGIVFSPLYRGFVERWATVEYLPLWGAAGQTRQRLVLTPAS